MEEQGFHINCLELKAVLLGLESLCSNLRQRHIEVQSDNTTAVAYINAIGGIKSADCKNMARQIWLWCIEREIWLSACHIPGSTKVVADSESRVFNTSTEWSLHQDLFDRINEMWGPFDIDHFASRLNFKIPTYVSWKPDPHAKHVNVLFMQLEEHYFYAFLPFSLIATCLRKIEQDQATGVILVPFWQTQPWFTTFLHLLIDNPVFLPRLDHLLTRPHNNTVHPLRKQLKLMACKVSGKASSRATYQLEQSSCSHGQMGRRNKQWIDFCCERQADPYNPPLTTVLDFLVNVQEKGLSYTTINTARSTISAITFSEDKNTIGCHPLVSRFLKGIYKGSPPTPR